MDKTEEREMEELKIGDAGKESDSKSSCGCGDAEEKKDYAKALQEQSKIECHGVKPAGEKVEERPETPAVQAEKARVKESKVLEGPKKTPTEKRVEKEEG
jgi:hypothetical protein